MAGAVRTADAEFCMAGAAGSGYRVSTPVPVAEARAALAGQLAAWREAAGLTQAQAGNRIGYSRSAVARAEATGVGSRDFCLRAGQLYGTGETLALAHDRIEALAAAARSQAARQARQARQPPLPAQAEDAETTFAVTEAACPYCGKPVAVLMRQSAALLPLESPATGHDPLLRVHVTCSGLCA